MIVFLNSPTLDELPSCCETNNDFSSHRLLLTGESKVGTDPVQSTFPYNQVAVNALPTHEVVTDRSFLPMMMMGGGGPFGGGQMGGGGPFGGGQMGGQMAGPFGAMGGNQQYGQQQMPMGPFGQQMGMGPFGGQQQGFNPFG